MYRKFINSFILFVEVELKITTSRFVFAFIHTLNLVWDETIHGILWTQRV
jgi:hypothetical protein